MVVQFIPVLCIVVVFDGVLFVDVVVQWLLLLFFEFWVLVEVVLLSMFLVRI